MTTLTIEIPETLAQQAQNRGISQQHLEKVVVHLVQIYLRELDQVSSDDEASQTEFEPTLTDGRAFAEQLIADNRALFEELARL